MLIFHERWDERRVRKLRIISGRARGKRLIEFSGQQVRPTADRVREAIFSILTSRLGSLNGCRVLDLFAGTGALALESLSRGAQYACLVESHTESIKIIQKNIDGCRMQDCTELLRGELPDALTQVTNNGSFDLIFLDPPYEKGLALATLAQLAAHNEILADKGLVVVETKKGEVLPDEIGPLEKTDQRHYGLSTISLFERRSTPA